MTSVGVRELRQRASELLRLVEQGETVEITDRGRPVARLTPLPAAPHLSRCARPAKWIQDRAISTNCPTRWSAALRRLRRLRRDER